MENQQKAAKESPAKNPTKEPTKIQNQQKVVKESPSKNPPKETPKITPKKKIVEDVEDELLFDDINSNIEQTPKKETHRLVRKNDAEISITKEVRS